jgi:molecular chaperone DnaK (HSP70)
MCSTPSITEIDKEYIAALESRVSVLENELGDTKRLLEYLYPWWVYVACPINDVIRYYWILRLGEIDIYKVEQENHNIPIEEKQYFKITTMYNYQTSERLHGYRPEITDKILEQFILKAISKYVERHHDRS